MTGARHCTHDGARYPHARWAHIACTDDVATSPARARLRPLAAGAAIRQSRARHCWNMQTLVFLGPASGTAPQSARYVGCRKSPARIASARFSAKESDVCEPAGTPASGMGGAGLLPGEPAARQRSASEPFANSREGPVPRFYSRWRDPRASPPHARGHRRAMPCACAD